MVPNQENRHKTSLFSLKSPDVHIPARKPKQCRFWGEMMGVAVERWEKETDVWMKQEEVKG